MSSYTIGECGEYVQGPIQNDIDYTHEYEPVCGCNGVNYGNSCSAWDNEITQYSLGECP